jgi:hypothetical protein
MARQADDHEQLATLAAELSSLTGEKQSLELEWLEAAAVLE